MIQFMQILEVEDNDENFPKTPVLQKSIVQCITDSPPYKEMTRKKESIGNYYCHERSQRAKERCSKTRGNI